jgi:Carboxypeptidase regulatory-like domain
MNMRFENKSRSHQGSGVGWIVTAVAILLMGVLSGSSPARAQAVYGSIYGTATDKTGASIPNAKITVTDVSKGTSVSVQSNASGLYRVQHLIPDTYTVQAEAKGYDNTLVKNVVVFADTAPEVNLQLSVGSTSETVTVTDQTPLLQTDRAEVSTILDARAVENLPNMDRNFTEFELLTPGTTYIGWSVGEGSGNPQRSGQIEVDGQLPFATGYELDGTDNQEPINGVAVINPNLDSVSEMKVNAQNYDAEFGKAVAGLVTAQTKSGSNQFHGSAFEYRRSNAQQARDPFANAPSASEPNPTLPSTLHNQFGGSIGGPIKKDKLFFFVDYQGLREKTGSSQLTTVPTLKAETTCTSGAGFCDLSDYISGTNTLQAYMPNSLQDTTDAGRTEFVNNQIPVADLSPAAVAFLKLLPAPNAGAPGLVTNNFAARGSGSFVTNQPDVRVDYQRSEKLHLFGRYTLFQGNISGSPYFGAAGGPGYGPGGFAGTDAFHYSSVASGGDYVVSPKWVTDFRFGYYRIYNNTTGPNATEPLGNDLGIPNANPAPLSLTGGLPQFNITIPTNGTNNGGNLEYGTSAALSLQQTSQYQIVNNWSHTAGNHNYKFGVDFRYGKNNSLSESGSGNVNFNGTYYASQSRTEGPNGVGNGFATFLLGDVTTFVRSVSATGGLGSTTQKRLFAYAQDQWHPTPKLSVNYGLRWELYTPEAVTKKGEGGLLNLDTGNIDIAGYGNINNELNVKNNRTEFAPRLGVSYQIFPKTVIRGGYGIVYGQGWAGNTFGDVLTNSYPLQIEEDAVPLSTAYGAAFNMTTTEDGTAAGPPGYVFPAIPATGEYALPNGISQSTRPNQVRLPTVAGWNLTVQQQLSQTFSLQIGYIGSQAYHNMFSSSNQFNANEATSAGFNQINPNTGVLYTLCEREPFCGDAGGNAQTLFGLPGRPYGWTQGISYNNNQATASYNGLQVIVNKALSHGLSFLSHYTWSHAIDHESYEFLVNPKIGRGNSYYNRRQAFVFAGDYDLPFGKGKQFASKISGWENEIIGGFQLNGTLNWSTGLPFSPCYNEVSKINDVAANDGCGPSWPNKVPGVGPHIHKGSFDPGSLTVPYLPTYANLLSNSPNDTEGAYALPAAGTFGNWGRDSLWGPGIVDVDASLAKNFDLFGNVKMQAIVQAYNVFNHVNYGGPANCIDCGASGQGSTDGAIQSTLSEQYGTSMRFLQFSARFTF